MPYSGVLSQDPNKVVVNAGVVFPAAMGVVVVALLRGSGIFQVHVLHGVSVR